ncbi:MAG TPA: AI-2E family transporter [Anaerolineales bacterium]|nr:AI-2E family transporter [Anaerolineales bacterium]
MKKNWNKETRIFVLALLIILLLLIGWYARELFSPLIIGGLIAYIMNPFVNMIKKRFKKVPHGLAVNIVYFIGLIFTISIPATLVPVLLGEIENLVVDLQNLPSIFNDFISRPLVILDYTIDISKYLPDLTDQFTTFLSGIPLNVIHLLESTSRNAGWLLVILVTIYYLLLDWNRVRCWMASIPTKHYYWDYVHLYIQIKKVWSAYLRGTLALMLIVGVAFTLVYLSIGLPGALIIGILAGLLSIIPELGPFISAAVAVAVALVEGSLYLNIPNFWFAVIVALIYVVLINIKGIWLRPKIMGRSVNLHEGLVFVAIMAAIIFQGVLGALIVIPVLASVVVIGRYIRRRLLGLPPFLRSDRIYEDEDGKIRQRNRLVQKLVKKKEEK